jgi:hypothetical protein
MSQLSRVAHHWSTVMVLMVVMEAMAVAHRPMVIVDHSQVDIAVSTVVPHNRYILRLDDRQAADRHDRDPLVVIVVVAHDMTRDDQVGRPLVGEAGQGLAQELDHHQPIRMKQAHASRHTYKIFTKVIIN